VAHTVAEIAALADSESGGKDLRGRKNRDRSNFRGFESRFRLWSSFDFKVMEGRATFPPYTGNGLSESRGKEISRRRLARTQSAKREILHFNVAELC
jgi:hypothetical protein